MRLAVAGQRVVADESLAAAVERYEASDLSERHKVALRFADALMTDPAGISDALLADLRTHFSDAELRELAVDVMKWNYQKVPVALGTDVEVRAGELTDLVFDDRGEWVRPG